MVRVIIAALLATIVLFLWGFVFWTKLPTSKEMLAPLMNGEAVRSCLLFAVQADGADLLTVEGLAPNETDLHPIQDAYWEAHGLQCGFCTPGFLITTLAFLRENPAPTEREIREALAGNLCRCTGYQNIVKAVQIAAERLQRGEADWRLGAELEAARQAPNA